MRNIRRRSKRCLAMFCVKPQIAIALALLLSCTSCRDPEQDEKRAQAEAEIARAEELLAPFPSVSVDATPSPKPLQERAPNTAPPIDALDLALRQAHGQKQRPESLQKARAALTRVLVLPPQERLRHAQSLRAAAELIDRLAAAEDNAALESTWERWNRARDARDGPRSPEPTSDAWLERTFEPFERSVARMSRGQPPLQLTLQISRGLSWLELSAWLPNLPVERQRTMEAAWQVLADELGGIEQALLNGQTGDSVARLNQARERWLNGSH